MFVIVFNASNIIPDGENNKLVYKFPNSVSLRDKYIAVSNINMFYSWFNITQTQANNYFTYTWTTGANTEVRTVNIPDGLYEIIDLNAYMQSIMIQNGDYLINAQGEYVYYAEILINRTRYAIQINTYYVPTVLPAGWSYPNPVTPNLPAVSQNPVVTIPANFNVIVGYTEGFTTNSNINGGYVPPAPAQQNNYVVKDGANTLSYLSNMSPEVQPNSSIYMSLSNINNPYSQPSSIIYTVSPTVAIGQQIVLSPPNFMWNKLIDGTYNEIRLTLLGQNFAPIPIRDPAMTFILTIRDKEESFLTNK